MNTNEVSLNCSDVIAAYEKELRDVKFQTVLAYKLRFYTAYRTLKQYYNSKAENLKALKDSLSTNENDSSEIMITDTTGNLLRGMLRELILLKVETSNGVILSKMTESKMSLSEQKTNYGRAVDDTINDILILVPNKINNNWCLVNVLGGLQTYGEELEDIFEFIKTSEYLDTKILLTVSPTVAEKANALNINAQCVYAFNPQIIPSWLENKKEF